MTIQLAVIGNPIEHSRSPDIHHAFAAQLGLDVRYERILGQSFVADVQQFLDKGGIGLNVTLPFKGDAFEFARTLSPRARLAEAVNTLWLPASLQAGPRQAEPLQGDPSQPGLCGDTTDGAGLVADLGNHGVDLADTRVLVLGAGGAVRGVLDDLAGAGVASIDVLNRTHARAVALEGRFSKVQAVTLASAGRDYDVVINGTSTGLQGTAPALPEAAVGAATVGYDMVYGPQDTPFMAGLRHSGATRVYEGLGMLVEQAALSFEIWTGATPQTAPVIADLRTKLGYRV